VSDLVADLNPEQRLVALHNGNALAIACPGAGKTKTMATKAALKLDEGDRACAVTFTREAAIELRERIMKLANPTGKSRLLVGTFHSICMLMASPHKFKGEFGAEILAEMRSPFAGKWNLVNEGVRRSYIIRAIRQSGANVQERDASPIIELAKEAGGKLEHLDPELQEMVNIYQQLIGEAGFIDFQDIILLTNRALREGKMTPLPVHDLLIDEYQDTDKAQYEWAAHHAKAGVRLTVVGDDDQSIYAFRRALGYAGMEQFVTQFKADQIRLGTNYRCHSEILGHAERLVQHNSQRIEKRLFAHRGPGGVVTYEAFKDNTSEYAAVAEEAISAVTEGVGFAVIARTNDELTLVQAAMMARGVPYRKTDGRSIFDCPEVQVYAALLRTLIQPTANDLDQVLAWAGMSPEDTSRLRKVFGNSVVMGSRDDLLNARITEKGMEIWRAFAKRYTGWAHMKEQNFLAMINLGVYEWLSETLQKPHSPAVLEAARGMFEVREGSLENHLDHLRAQQDKQSKSDKKNEKEASEQASVLLTTAHGSKGLEFDRVWIVGLDTGTFPSDKSALDEERRLMFVAMTRAKDVLFLSGTTVKKPSVFLFEAGLLPNPASKGSRN